MSHCDGFYRISPKSVVSRYCYVDSNNSLTIDEQLVEILVELPEMTQSNSTPSIASNHTGIYVHA